MCFVHWRRTTRSTPMPIGTATPNPTPTPHTGTCHTVVVRLPPPKCTICLRLHARCETHIIYIYSGDRPTFSASIWPECLRVFIQAKPFDE